MIEIIIFAIIAFFVLKKLHSILGEEDEKVFFDDNDRSFYVKKKIKDAEKVEEQDANEAVNNEFNYLTEEAKRLVNEISERIDGFSLKKFQSIAIKVLEIVINANNNRDQTTIKKFLSPSLSGVVCASFEEENKSNIILVECEESKINNITRNGTEFKIDVIFKMKQINYITNKDNIVIDGDKSEIVIVKEKWTFMHDFATKNKTWFVEKIEEC